MTPIATMIMGSKLRLLSLINPLNKNFIMLINI